MEGSSPTFFVQKTFPLPIHPSPGHLQCAAVADEDEDAPDADDSEHKDPCDHLGLDEARGGGDDDGASDYVGRLAACVARPNGPSCVLLWRKR